MNKGVRIRDFEKVLLAGTLVFSQVTHFHAECTLYHTSQSLIRFTIYG